ncbi:tail fiber assembly protein, partial [Escherichia coli]
MNSVFFSPGSKSFYLQELFPEYEDAGTLPDDVIEITREIYEQFLGLHPEGKEIGADSSGRPIWINSPPPSKEDEVLMAEMKKISLVSEANTYINTHQWPGKAAIG